MLLGGVCAICVGLRGMALIVSIVKRLTRLKRIVFGSRRIESMYSDYDMCKPVRYDMFKPSEHASKHDMDKLSSCYINTPPRHYDYTDKEERAYKVGKTTGYLLGALFLGYLGVSVYKKWENEWNV
jgi:hypothetical protein